MTKQATRVEEIARQIREAAPGARLQIPMSCEVRQVGGPEARTLRFTASNEVVDRYNTIIKVDGWDLRNWMENPVIQYGHDSSQPPIGRGVKAVREQYVRADGTPDKRLAIDVEFVSREVYPFADMIYELYRGGFLSAVSVGFDVLEKREPSDEEVKRYGLTEKSGTVVLARNELFELSAVNIPGNPQALIDTLATYAPELRETKPEAVTEEWLGEQLEAIRGGIYGVFPGNARRPELMQDVPLTERRLREILAEFFTRGESRMGDCLRGLAKRSEVINLGLQIEDLRAKVDGQRAAPRRRTDVNLYDAALAGNLKAIAENLNLNP